MGAIIRSAYCVGADGVILPQKNSSPLNSAAIKAAAGLSEYMPILQVANALTAAQELQTAGYNLYLATFDGKDATKVAYKKPLCIVVGSEGFGISKAMMGMGEKVTLPQREGDISYNASVAASLFNVLGKVILLKKF